MPSTLDDSVALVMNAGQDYLQVFGPDAPDATHTDELRVHVTRVYRKLAGILHPDRNWGDDDAFQELGRLRDLADKAIVQGRWGHVELMTFKFKRATHKVFRSMGSGDISNLFQGETRMANEITESVIKIAKVPGDNDLLKTEAEALKLLHADPEDLMQRHYPRLLDSFGCRPDGIKKNGLRQANVLAKVPGLTLLELGRQTELGVRHPVWIWRRLLTGLAFAHERGVIHGAIVPEHIQIIPKDHGVVLLDWCYASIGTKVDAGSGLVGWDYPPIKAMVQGRSDFYPDEVRDKKPPKPGTDLRMAAFTVYSVLMMSATERIPPQMTAYFRGCLTTSMASRPQNAWALLEEFDQMLEKVGEPFYPRRWVELEVPE